MNNEKFFAWCRVAVKGIKYRPDRDAVHEELYEHMEDRYESFRCRGLEHEEAVDKTLEAMGSAEELAPLLAKAHRPFWPYLLSISRTLLIVAIIITVLPFGWFIFKNTVASFETLNYGDACDVYADSENYLKEAYAKQMLYLEPKCSAKVDGYTVRITKAAWWRTEYTNGGGHDRFYLRVKVTNLFPLEELAVNVDDYFWAEDSLGNHYYSDAEIVNYHDPHLTGGDQRVGFFSHTFELTLSNYVSQDAQWIDLHYDRDGRNFVLRIDLSGGENP